jgi:hypothetical protein
VSEDPAQETGTEPRPGAGDSVAPPGHDPSSRPGHDGKPPHPPGPTPGQRGARWALWLGTGSLVLSLFQTLYRPVGLILAVGAIILGVQARRRARREHSLATGAVAGIVMGAVAIALSIPVLAINLFFRAEMDQYAKCRTSANTITDEQACKDAFARSVEKKLKLRPGSMRGGEIPF